VATILLCLKWRLVNQNYQNNDSAPPTSTPQHCGPMPPWPPHSWGFYSTHIDALQSGGLLWANDRLVTETSPCHHTAVTTNIHAPSDIRTHNFSRQAAEDLRPILRDNRDRSPCLYRSILWLLNENKGTSERFGSRIRHSLHGDRNPYL
jgi:hypothetical protein